MSAPSISSGPGWSPGPKRETQAQDLRDRAAMGESPSWLRVNNVALLRRNPQDANPFDKLRESPKAGAANPEQSKSKPRALDELWRECSRIGHACTQVLWRGGRGGAKEWIRVAQSPDGRGTSV